MSITNRLIACKNFSALADIYLHLPRRLIGCYLAVYVCCDRSLKSSHFVLLKVKVFQRLTKLFHIWKGCVCQSIVNDTSLTMKIFASIHINGPIYSRNTVQFYVCFIDAIVNINKMFISCSLLFYVWFTVSSYCVIRGLQILVRVRLFKSCSRALGNH